MTNDDLTMCAFRYVLGRSTYLVAYMTGHLIENWSMINEKFQDIIVDEIVEAILAEEAGDSVDVERWEAVLKNADAELLEGINKNSSGRARWHTRIER